MKRYASHYLFVAGQGCLKQACVEVEEGRVARIFRLGEETEDTEWLPGAILIHPRESAQSPKQLCLIPTEIRHNFIPQLLKEIPVFFKDKMEYCAVYFPAFSFTAMQPVAGTRHIPLR